MDANKEKEPEEEGNDDETNFGGDDFNLLDSLTWLQNKRKTVNTQEKFFGNKQRSLFAS